jgi:pimeloyl-ACP methyl ester carboxylesterase
MSREHAVEMQALSGTHPFRDGELHDGICPDPSSHASAASHERPCRRRAGVATGHLLAALVLLLDGCGMQALWGSWVRRLHPNEVQALGIIGGNVTTGRAGDGPIVVVAARGPHAEVVDVFVLERAGYYYFVLPRGTYRIAAFVDRSRDRTYRANDDPAAYYGAPTDVRLAAGRNAGELDIHIPSEPGDRLDFSVAPADVAKQRTHDLPPIRLGEIVHLDDPRFSAANSKLGVWRPVEFLFDVGAGIYLLDPFDPTKLPVLFVHGVGGEPSSWRYLLDHLDRTEVQPWILHYPTGLDLDVTAHAMDRWVHALVERYGFRRLAVVAHSAGGLVARAAIEAMANDGDAGMVALLVTISTPWGGQPEAATGVKHSPVVRPMWTDLAPDSKFLEALFRTSLPGSPFYLFYGHHGVSHKSAEPNDGVVPVSSALASPAERAATEVVGFDETHQSILTSQLVLQKLNALLAGSGSPSPNVSSSRR